MYRKHWVNKLGFLSLSDANKWLSEQKKYFSGCAKSYKFLRHFTHATLILLGRSTHDAARVYDQSGRFWIGHLRWCLVLKMLQPKWCRSRLGRPWCWKHENITEKKNKEFQVREDVEVIFEVTWSHLKSFQYRFPDFLEIGLHSVTITALLLVSWKGARGLAWSHRFCRSCGVTAQATQWTLTTVTNTWNRYSMIFLFHNSM